VTNNGRKEHPVLFADEKSGWLPDKPNEIAFTLTRYTFALTVASDMLEENRNTYLDFGCGTGLGTELIASSFKKSYGVEKRPECIEYAVRVHNRAPISYLHNLPDGATFDYVTMLEAIEHLDQAEAVTILRAISSAMPAHGVLYITTPVSGTHDGSNPDNTYHKHEYHPGELKTLLERFFYSVEIRNFLGVDFLQAICQEPKK